MNQPLSDQMEAYLQGMLSTDQESDFLARVEQDPLLKGELTLQQDILNGIRAERRTSLKQRLNHLEVPAAGPSAGASWLRPFGFAIGGAAVVGAIIWAITGSEPEQPTEQDRTIARTEQPSAEVARPLTPAASSANGTDGAGQAEEPSEAPDHSQAPEQDHVLTEGQAMTNATLTPPAETAEPARAESSRPAHASRHTARRHGNAADASDEASGNVENPDVKVNNNQGFTGKGDITVPTGKVVEQGEIASKPDMVVTESDNLGYQYYDNKVHIFGPKEGELFELIEVHARQEKRVYVYYLDQFYMVRDNTRVTTPLDPITDKVTIEELEHLRKRRVD